jgi:opacity protein-like surface antigen
MRKTFTFIAIMCAFTFGALAVSAQDHNKFEFYGGYLFHNISTGFGDLDTSNTLDNRVTAHGWNLSATGNISKRFGIKFDYSSTGREVFDSDAEAALGFDTDTKLRVNQYLGGIQIKNNEKDGPRFKPFAHVLAGVANERIRCTQNCDFAVATPTLVGGTSTFNESTNSFAMVFGAGIDVKVSNRVDIRIIQFDYNPIFYGGVPSLDLPDRTQNNFRIGFGVAIH